jgi:hypothetical protein
VFTGGKVPYADIHPLELMNQLKGGLRPDMPRNAACTDEM